MTQMRQHGPGKGLTAFLGVAVGLVLGGGIGAAATSSTNPITACAQKKTGALRLATKGKCGKAEKKVSWAVTGPQGATGGQGPKGDQGPVGPSAAYAVHRAAGPSDLTTGSTTIATLASLPAGAYLIQAMVDVTGSASATATDVTCTLHADADTASATAYAGSVAGGTFTVTMPVLLTHTFIGTGVVSLSCTKDLSSVAAISNTRIVATMLGHETHGDVTG